MQILTFDTSVLPASQRLAAFQAGATEYQVDAVGDALAFAARWRLLVLGDLNAIESSITPVRYLRDQVRIDADGKDRVAILYHEEGSARGVHDGRDFAVEPGAAMVWDLTRPLDVWSNRPTRCWIITMPRHLLHEVLPDPSPAGVIEASPELSLAMGRMRYLFDNADALPDEAAAFYGRGLRSLFAAAMLPVTSDEWLAKQRSAPLLQRISAYLDRATGESVGEEAIARGLGVEPGKIREAIQRLGGLESLAERRRLLAAYRMLLDPSEIAPISRIAQRCGFRDLPRFSRRFREVFSASATETRRQRVGRLPRWAGAYDVETHYAPMLSSERARRVNAKE